MLISDSDSYMCLLHRCTRARFRQAVIADTLISDNDSDMCLLHCAGAHWHDDTLIRHPNASAKSCTSAKANCSMSSAPLCCFILQHLSQLMAPWGQGIDPRLSHINLICLSCGRHHPFHRAPAAGDAYHLPGGSADVLEWVRWLTGAAVSTQ